MKILEACTLFRVCWLGFAVIHAYSEEYLSRNGHKLVCQLFARYFIVESCVKGLSPGYIVIQISCYEDILKL